MDLIARKLRDDQDDEDDGLTMDREINFQDQHSEKANKQIINFEINQQIYNQLLSHRIVNNVVVEDFVSLINKSQNNNINTNQNIYLSNQSGNYSQDNHLTICDLHKTKVIQVKHCYNINSKSLTIKKYFNSDSEEDWKYEVDLLKTLSQFEITLPYVSSGKEGDRYFIEQVAGQKDLKKVKQNCYPYVIKKSDETKEIYDRFLSISFIRLLQKLRKMHSLGYAHSDIKPMNIVIGYDFDCYFIDFGASVRISDHQNYSAYLKQYTPFFNLQKYVYRDSNSKIYQVYQFKNQKEIVQCEISQLALTFLYMIYTNKQENLVKFSNKEFKFLIDQYSKEFPQTIDLIKLTLKEVGYLEAEQDDYDCFFICIDKWSHFKICDMISDIKYENNIYNIKRINSDTIYLIDQISQNNQKLSIIPRDTEIVPLIDNNEYKNLIAKFPEIDSYFNNITDYNQDPLFLVNLIQEIKHSSNRYFKFELYVEEFNILLDEFQEINQDKNLDFKIKFKDGFPSLSKIISQTLTIHSIHIQHSDEFESILEFTINKRNNVIPKHFQLSLKYLCSRRFQNSDFEFMPYLLELFNNQIIELKNKNQLYIKENNKFFESISILLTIDYYFDYKYEDFQSWKFIEFFQNLKKQEQLPIINKISVNLIFYIVQPKENYSNPLTNQEIKILEQYISIKQNIIIKNLNIFFESKEEEIKIKKYKEQEVIEDYSSDFNFSDKLSSFKHPTNNIEQSDFNSKDLNTLEQNEKKSFDESIEQSNSKIKINYKPTKKEQSTSIEEGQQTKSENEELFEFHNDEVNIKKQNKKKYKNFKEQKQDEYSEISVHDEDSDKQEESLNILESSYPSKSEYEEDSEYIYNNYEYQNEYDNYDTYSQRDSQSFYKQQYKNSCFQLILLELTQLLKSKSNFISIKNVEITFLNFVIENKVIQFLQKVFKDYIYKLQDISFEILFKDCQFSTNSIKQIFDLSNKIENIKYKYEDISLADKDNLIMFKIEYNMKEVVKQTPQQITITFFNSKKIEKTEEEFKEQEISEEGSKELQKIQQKDQLKTQKQEEIPNEQQKEEQEHQISQEIQLLNKINIQKTNIIFSEIFNEKYKLTPIDRVVKFTEYERLQQNKVLFEYYDIVRKIKQNALKILNYQYDFDTEMSDENTDIIFQFQKGKLNNEERVKIMHTNLESENMNILYLTYNEQCHSIYYQYRNQSYFYYDAPLVFQKDKEIFQSFFNCISYIFSKAKTFKIKENEYVVKIFMKDVIIDSPTLFVNNLKQFILHKKCQYKKSFKLFFHIRNLSILENQHEQNTSDMSQAISENLNKYRDMYLNFILFKFDTSPEFIQKCPNFEQIIENLDKQFKSEEMHFIIRGNILKKNSLIGLCSSLPNMQNSYRYTFDLRENYDITQQDWIQFIKETSQSNQVSFRVGGNFKDKDIIIKQFKENYKLDHSCNMKKDFFSNKAQNMGGKYFYFVIDFSDESITFNEEIFLLYQYFLKTRALNIFSYASEEQLFNYLNFSFYYDDSYISFGEFIQQINKFNDFVEYLNDIFLVKQKVEQKYLISKVLFYNDYKYYERILQETLQGKDSISQNIENIDTDVNKFNDLKNRQVIEFNQNEQNFLEKLKIMLQEEQDKVLQKQKMLYSGEQDNMEFIYQ